MMSSLSIALVAIAAVSADNYNYSNYQNQNAQNYQYTTYSAEYYDEYLVNYTNTSKTYSNGNDPTRIQISNCENSVVQVTNVNILCDSPYRTYYSNGAHMASELCDYGDKAVVMVFFEMETDLNWMEAVYMTFAIYAGKQTKELLWAVRSVELCHTFVGHACNLAGNYAFAFQVSLDYGQMSDRSLFVPMIEMGFSTRADEGYNVGGVNIDCRFGPFYKQYDPWYNGRQAHSSQLWGAGGLGKAGGQYGFLISSVLVGVAAIFYTYYRRKQGIMFKGNADQLMDDASA